MINDPQRDPIRRLPQAESTAAAIPEAQERYDVQAEAALADELDQVLKHGDSFAVFDRFGDIRPVGLGEEGIYHLGTRHLSGFGLRINGKRPLLLGSTAKRESTRLAVDLTNPDLESPKGRIAHATIHLSRTKVLWDGACYERIVARNFGQQPVTFTVSLSFAADFADIFEVRGMVRPKRGRFLQPKAAGSEVLLRYAGLDEVVRRTRITFSVAPDRMSDREASFRVRLPPTRATNIDVTIACEADGRHPRALPIDEAFARARALLPAVLAAGARISTSNALFNEWLGRSAADLAMLTTETPQGPYPYAGVPWFSTEFGRDGLVTALQHLWIDPGLALGVLDYLATYQAAEADPLVAIAGGGGVALFNSQGNPWTADYLKITGELDVDLRSNIAAEARAKIVYERLLGFTEDRGTKEALQFLMTREITHMKAFMLALESMGKDPLEIGVIPPTDGLVDQYFSTSTGDNVDEGEDSRGPWNEGNGWVYVDAPALNGLSPHSQSGRPRGNGVQSSKPRKKAGAK